jgi:hypothetical protein
LAARERLINEADVPRLWDRLSLDHLLKRSPSRAGSAAAREALRRRRAGAGVTKSQLEEMLTGLLDELGLPRPETNTGALSEDLRRLLAPSSWPAASRHV